MKLLKNIALFCLYLLCASNDYPKDGSDKSSLKGRIKTLSDVTFSEFYDCELHRSYITTKTVYHFDRSGRIISEEHSTNYNDSPVIKSHFSKTADRKELSFYQNELLIKKEVYSDRKLWDIQEFEYDKENRLVATYSTVSGKRKQSSVCHYDGSIETKMIFSEYDSSKIQRKYVTVKDEKGNTLEKRDSAIYNGQSYLNNLAKFKSGRIVETWRVNGDLDSVCKDTELIYDDQGNLIEYRSFYEHGGLWNLWQFKYDNELLVFLDKDDMSPPISDEMYNDMFEGVDKKQFDHDETITYKYEDIDSHGNYRKKTEFSTKYIPAVTNRTIEYYK